MCVVSKYEVEREIIMKAGADSLPDTMFCGSARIAESVFCVAIVSIAPIFASLDARNGVLSDIFSHNLN